VGNIIHARFVKSLASKKGSGGSENTLFHGRGWTNNHD
jgi:hypothetical protein